MDKEYQFFICNNKSRWLEGIGKNIEITESGIKLTSSIEYIFKDSLYMEASLKDRFLKDEDNKILSVSVLEDGDTYILDAHNSIWHWSHLNRQFKRMYTPSDTRAYKKILVSQGMILLFSKDQKWLRVVDTGMGQIIRDIELEQYFEGQILAVELNDDSIYLAHQNKGLQLLSYEIRTGHLEIVSEHDFTDIKQVILKHHERIVMAVVTNQLTFIDGEHRADVELSEKLLEFTITEGGYYLSLMYRNANHKPITSLYRTDMDLNRVYHIKDTYGVGDGLYVDQTGMYQWFGDGWCLNFYQLGEVYRKETKIKDNIVTGHYLSRCFDCYVEKETWHRYLVDFITGHNTRIKVNFYTTDDNRIIYQDRKMTISEFMSLEAITFDEKKKVLCNDSYFKSDCLNAHDGLFQNTNGRYLWFNIELMGTTKRSPLVKSIQMFYKRRSYLRYLPEVYQQDKNSVGFLSRFLSIYESYLSDMEEQIDQVHKTFEPDLNTGENLRFIGSWLGLELDNSWNDEQIKKMVKVSSQLYKRKGTKYSIETILEIYLDEKPYIMESFEIKKQGIKEGLFDDNHFTFYVLVSKKAMDSKVKIANTMNILKMMKPAHTQAKLIILEETILLGDHCYIGMNTSLSGYDSLILDNQTYLLNDTVIYDVIDENRIGRDARLDQETYLK